MLRRNWENPDFAAIANCLFENFTIQCVCEQTLPIDGL